MCVVRSHEISAWSITPFHTATSSIIWDTNCSSFQSDRIDDHPKSRLEYDFLNISSLVLVERYYGIHTLPPDLTLHRSSFVDEWSLWCHLHSRNRRIHNLLSMESRNCIRRKLCLGYGQVQGFSPLEGLPYSSPKRIILRLPWRLLGVYRLKSYWRKTRSISVLHKHLGFANTCK
jgi:hypothetical protein